PLQTGYHIRGAGCPLVIADLDIDQVRLGSNADVGAARCRAITCDDAGDVSAVTIGVAHVARARVEFDLGYDAVTAQVRVAIDTAVNHSNRDALALQISGTGKVPDVCSANCLGIDA